ncbi:hypothetical protein DIRU0_D23134 [Diutina rugosa]
MSSPHRHYCLAKPANKKRESAVARATPATNESAPVSATKATAPPKRRQPPSLLVIQVIHRHLASTRPIPFNYQNIRDETSATLELHRHVRGPIKTSGPGLSD